MTSRRAQAEWILAGLLVSLLPFTSFPPLSRLLRSSMVAPLSVLPMLALFLLYFLPHLWRGGALPAQILPALGFIVLAFLSSAAAFFLPFPPFKDASILGSEIEALATLLLGFAFLLVVAAWGNRPERLRFLLRWVNWGGVLLLAWGFFQALAWRLWSTYPEWMWQIQGRTVTSYLLYAGRINSFAYEPSWMAHQLNMLYLPIWLSAAVTGFTAHNIRIWRLHLEHFLLAAGLVALFLTVSRIGLLSFLLMTAYLLLVWSGRLVNWAKEWLARRQANERSARRVRRWFPLLGALALIVIYIALLAGAAYGLSRYDERMARVFDFSTLREGSLLHYANQLVFAERLVFWQAGWEVFNDFPILGVGLGNAGFFFPENLSAFSWSLTEVRILMYRWSVLPNIKSLWIRLLAETGIVGLAMMVCWCYVLWKTARHLSVLPDRLSRMAGLVGAFAVIGFLVEGFSVDTFALPYFWVSFGLLSAAFSLNQAVKTEGERGGLHGEQQ